MDEITFMDALSHYQTVLSQLSEEVERIRSQLLLSRQTLDESWSGPAAEACRLKLETLYPELNRVLSELSDARLRLSIVGDAWQEEQEALITDI